MNNNKLLLIMKGGWALYLLVLVISSLTPLQLPELVPNEDKYLHFLAYGGLVVLWPEKKGKKMRIVLYAALIGALLEIGQGILPINRCMDIWDAIANATGAVLGMCGFQFAEMFGRTREWWPTWLE